MDEDGVLAYGNYGWGDMWDFSSQENKRRDAIASVCQKLPEDVYQQFKQGMQDRVWFTPPIGLGGCVKEVPQRKIIYVSPIWEGAVRELIEYVVLHEMAHVILAHNTNLDRSVEADRKLDSNQEQQVDEMITRIGFANLHDEAIEFIAQVKANLAGK